MQSQNPVTMEQIHREKKLKGSKGHVATLLKYQQFFECPTGSLHAKKSER